MQELIDKFSGLRVSKVVYFGYLFDPLFSWAVICPGARANYLAFRGCRQRFAGNLSKIMGRGPSILQSAFASLKVNREGGHVESRV